MAFEVTITDRGGVAVRRSSYSDVRHNEDMLLYRVIGTLRDDLGVDQAQVDAWLTELHAKYGVDGVIEIRPGDELWATAAGTFEAHIARV